MLKKWQNKLLGIIVLVIFSVFYFSNKTDSEIFYFNAKQEVDNFLGNNDRPVNYEVYIPLDLLKERDKYKTCIEENEENCSKIIMNYLFN